MPITHRFVKFPYADTHPRARDSVSGVQTLPKHTPLRYRLNPLTMSIGMLDTMLASSVITRLFWYTFPFVNTIPQETPRVFRGKSTPETYWGIVLKNPLTSSTANSPQTEPCQRWKLQRNALFLTVERRAYCRGLLPTTNGP
jgi:hypothetical protein